jgi:hypothetical protein
MKLYFSCRPGVQATRLSTAAAGRYAPTYALTPSLSRIAVSVEAASKSGRLLI